MVGTEQGLYARVAPLAQPVLRLRSSKPDGTSCEREFPLDADLLAQVRRDVLKGKEVQVGGWHGDTTMGRTCSQN